MILCPVCGQRASSTRTLEVTTTLNGSTAGTTYEAERYAHARDVCITAWRPVMAPAR